MKKYIAVVNPKMEEDDIAYLIRQGIAGALFQVSHQNYPLAMKLIDLVKKLGAKYHRPISIIQDVSNMEDPLDLEVGLKSGVHWVASDKAEHMKLARGLDKLAGLIFKGRTLPKDIRIDSILADNFLDPDAEVMGQKSTHQIKHLTTEHKNQHLLDSILHVSHHADTHAIAVSDLDLAKALSIRRPKRKIIFSAPDHKTASKSAIYWGVHPIVSELDPLSAARAHGIVKKGRHLVDATEPKHVTIHVV